MPDSRRESHNPAERIDPETLADLPLFKDLPAGELEVLSDQLCIREIPANTLLFREGEPGDHFYIIAAGELEVVKALGDDGEWRVAVLGPGEFLGDLSLLNPDRLRTASVRSRGPARLWEMHHTDVESLLERQPQVAYQLVSTLGDRLTKMDNAIIADLLEKNRQLTRSYTALQAAQAQVIEKEKLEQELQVAYDIQMGILPQSLPTLPGYDFGARIIPARAVGGDFFDLISLGSGQVGILVGDVADKGVPAAIFMARAHALLYAEIFQCPTPAEVLQRVNRHLMKINVPNLFVTVLYGVLDSQTGNFDYARAGHELPILAFPGGEPYRAPMGLGQMLGVLDEPVLDQQSLAIAPGGTLLLYTDGLTEGRSALDESFGVTRLMSELHALSGQPAQLLCNQLLDSLVAFQGGTHLEDDVTLVVVQASG
jgi:serine phosphatase RsbU (regulator of sigma subunit)